ncbi:MAG: hypothetical protein ACE5LU_30000 [Anaerolineae bacterium]
MAEKAHPEPTTNDGIGYCVGGVVALIVGYFALGIVMGLLAVHLGNRGIEHGATTFGTIVKVGGWLETILTGVGIVAMIVGAY